MDYANFSSNVLNKTTFLGKQTHADSEAVAFKTDDGKPKLYARDASAKTFTAASVSSLFNGAYSKSAAENRLGKFNDGLSNHKAMVSAHLTKHGVSDANVQKVLGLYNSAGPLTVGEARKIDSHVQAAILMKKFEGMSETNSKESITLRQHISDLIKTDPGILNTMRAEHVIKLLGETSDTNSKEYITLRQHISKLIKDDPTIINVIGVEKLKAEYEKQFSTILKNMDSAINQIDDPLTPTADRNAASLSLKNLEAEMRNLADENPHLKQSIQSELGGLDKSSYSKFSHWLGSSSSYTQASLKLYCAKTHINENIGAAEVIIKLDDMMRKEFGSLIADVAVATGLLNKLKDDYLDQNGKYAFNISSEERARFTGKIDKFTDFLTKTAAMAGNEEPNSALLSAASRRTRDFLSSTGEMEINLESMLDAEDAAAASGQSPAQQATSGIQAGFTKSFESLDHYFSTQFSVFTSDICPRIMNNGQSEHKVWL